MIGFCILIALFSDSASFLIAFRIADMLSVVVALSFMIGHTVFAIFISSFVGMIWFFVHNNHLPDSILQADFKSVISLGVSLSGRIFFKISPTFFSTHSGSFILLGIIFFAPFIIDGAAPIAHPSTPPVVTPSGVIVPLLATSYLAPASAPSIPVLIIFPAVPIGFMNHNLLGQASDATISVPVSHTFADRVFGSNGIASCTIFLPCSQYHFNDSNFSKFSF